MGMTARLRLLIVALLCIAALPAVPSDLGPDLAAEGRTHHRALPGRRLERRALPHRRRQALRRLEAAGDRRQQGRRRRQHRRGDRLQRAEPTATPCCAARPAPCRSTTISTRACPTTGRSSRPSRSWRCRPTSSPRARTCRPTPPRSSSPGPRPIPARRPMPARATARPRTCRRRCWRRRPGSRWCTCPTRVKARRWSTSAPAGSTSSSAPSPPRCASRRAAR